MIAHISLHDLQRNAGRYTSEAHDEFAEFVPGWREKIVYQHEPGDTSRHPYPLLV